MRLPVLIRVAVIAAMLAVDGRGLPLPVSRKAAADGDVSSAIVLLTAESDTSDCCGTTACCCCGVDANAPSAVIPTVACCEQSVASPVPMRVAAEEDPIRCGCSARQIPDAPRLPVAPSPTGDHETSLDLLSLSNTTALLSADVAEAPRPAAICVSFPSPLQRQLALLCCWRT